MSCRCHPASIYGSLLTCPACGHRSYDPWCDACERRACGYTKETTPHEGDCK